MKDFIYKVLNGPLGPMILALLMVACISIGLR